MSGIRNAADSAVSGNCAGAGEFMLFGVRVVVDSMRKSVSMNNLSQYEHPQDATNNSGRKEDTVATGYASADEAVHRNSGRNRERKRGVPWSEDEHKLFLLGLQKVGKGDWRGISRNFVKTRTPTQVASHAQKYFLRRNNLNRRRRRSSLFDITTDWVTTPVPLEKEQGQYQDNLPTQLVRPVPISLDANASTVPCDDNTNLNSAIDPASLSLQLSLPSEPRATPSRHSAFQAIPCFKNGDNIISVA